MKDLALIDMHTHTCYSDGELSPNDLVKQAEKEGIKTLGITDHDTLLGVQNMTVPEDKRKIDVINGIEISIKVTKGRMHILGYDIDIWNKELNDKMQDLHTRSLYSVSGIICQLKKDYGIVFSSEEILNILNAKRNIGRPDVAKLLIKHGYVSSVKEAFDKYLVAAYKKIGDVAKGIPFPECAKLIHGANGLVILAHPESLELEGKSLERKIKYLVDNGLDGIEVYHSNHTKENTEEYLRLAKKYNLLISGGSDFHGPNVKPDVILGKGRNNIKVQELTLLDEIKRRQK